MKNHTDVLIFHTAICAEASQISLDATTEIAYTNFCCAIPSLRFGMEVSMALQDDLREQLIKQFAADVVILTEDTGKEYYACPTCKRHVSLNAEKCQSCDQVLKWDAVKKKEIETLGVKTATLTFEVPGDFVKSDCRKCPISYIGKTEGDSVYECPLGRRNNCPLEIK